MSQPKVKAKTLQQKMGFVDVDLRTPQHDAIMLWLDQEIGNIMVKKHRQEWSKTEIDIANEIMLRWINGYKERTQQEVLSGIHYAEERKQWLSESLLAISEYTPGCVPPKKAWLTEKTWEHPVSSKTNYVVGFIDMKVVVGYETEITVVEKRNNRFLLPAWSTREESETYLFEVKPTIPSVGELIRQVRLYQQYERGHYVVVSPDDRFASIIEGQGIEFLKVEV